MNHTNETPATPSGWTTAQLLSGLLKVACLLEEHWPGAVRAVAVEDRALVREVLDRTARASLRLLDLLEEVPPPPTEGCRAGRDGGPRRASAAAQS